MTSARVQARDGRLAAVRRAMAQRGIEVLVAYGSGRHRFLGANACWHLSGLRQVGPHAAMLVPLEGDPALVVTPAWDAERARRRSWIEDVVATDDLADALRALVRDRGWRTRAAAVAGQAEAPATLHAVWGEVFERPPADGADLLAEAARVPDAWALDLIERGVAIAEAGYDRLCEVARPGLPEHELAAEVDVAIRALGADDNFQLMSASQHNRGVRQPGDRVLAEGDVVLGEISPSVEGQFSQICRSAVVGAPTDDQRDSFAVLLDAFDVGLRRATPGTRLRDVAGEMNALLADRGYGEFNRPPYMRTRGHGMGLGAFTPLDVSDSSDVVLEVGMSFVLHPNQYFPGCGYLLCGDQVLIEKDGARSLAQRGPQLDTVGVEVAA